MALTGIEREIVKSTFYDVLKDKRCPLGHETSKVAEAHGIPVSPVRLATSEDEAAAIAEEIGYPVVLKILR